MEYKLSVSEARAVALLAIAGAAFMIIVLICAVGVLWDKWNDFRRRAKRRTEMTDAKDQA